MNKFRQYVDTLIKMLDIKVQIFGLILYPDESNANMYEHV